MSPSWQHLVLSVFVVNQQHLSPKIESYYTIMRICFVNFSASCDWLWCLNRVGIDSTCTSKINFILLYFHNKSTPNQETWDSLLQIQGISWSSPLVMLVTTCTGLFTTGANRCHNYNTYSPQIVEFWMSVCLFAFCVSSLVPALGGLHRTSSKNSYCGMQQYHYWILN